MFQSTPLTEARGDSESSKLRLPDQCFNPLPSPKQGEMCLVIHACACWSSFQSAPLTEAREIPQ